MTSRSLFTRLAALPPTTIFRDRGATAAEIREIEERNELQLPDDLRDTLLFSNGLGIESTGTGLALYNDRLGRGSFAVYLVRMSDLDVRSSKFVGGSFTDVVETTLAGTDLYKRPELRHE